MYVAVMTKSELATLVSSPNNQIISACIFELHDTTIFTGNNFVTPHWDLFLVRQQALFLELGQVNQARLSISHNNLVTHEGVPSTLSVVVPSPNIGPTSTCAGNGVGLTHLQVHQRCVILHIVFVQLHELA